MKLLFLFSFCVACFLSCTSVSKKEILYANLTDSSKFVLLPTDGIEQTMDMAQFLSAEIRGQTYFINSWVKADENAIEMTFFNEMGASLGELSYTNGLVHVSSTVIPRSVLQSFKAEFVIAEFQLCFYDPLLLEKSLKDSGLTLETTTDENQNSIRRVLNRNDVIIEIEKTANTVKVSNHLRGYAYTLQGVFHE